MSAPIDWNEDGQGHVEGHPIPLRYERDGRFVRFNSGGYIAPVGESISARLHHFQLELDEAKQAFAASQADLTRALADGDRIAARLMDERVARNLAEAELATARAELERLRKNEQLRAQVIRERNAELAQLSEDNRELRAQLTVAIATRTPDWKITNG